MFVHDMFCLVPIYLTSYRALAFYSYKFLNVMEIYTQRNFVNLLLLEIICNNLKTVPKVYFIRVNKTWLSTA